MISAPRCTYRKGKFRGGCLDTAPVRRTCCSFPPHRFALRSIHKRGFVNPSVQAVRSPLQAVDVRWGVGVLRVTSNSAPSLLHAEVRREQHGEWAGYILLDVSELQLIPHLVGGLVRSPGVRVTEVLTYCLDYACAQAWALRNAHRNGLFGFRIYVFRPGTTRVLPRRGLVSTA